MLRERLHWSTRSALRRSERFEQFLKTRTATVLAAVMSVAAVAGAGVAIWRSEWVDAFVRVALASVFALWTVTHAGRSHGGPPRAT